jgi:hypothetical protein
MFKLLSRVGFALMVLIVVGITTCSVEGKLLRSDPATAAAMSQAEAAGRPLLTSLDGYHAAHGYYPRTLDELHMQPPPPPDFVYEVTSLNRVYASFDCSSRAQQFNGINTQPSTYEQRLSDFLRECVHGYSGFVLKAPRIHTAWRVNANLLAFASFASQGGQWNVDWCRTAHNVPSAPVDCRYMALNETTRYQDNPVVMHSHPHRVERHSAVSGSTGS